MRQVGHASSMPSIAGALGYFELADWWLGTFTEDEREHIEGTFQPIGLEPGSRPLTHGDTRAFSRSRLDLLSGLAGWFTKPEERSIMERIFAEAERQITATSTALDLHFHHQQVAENLYGGW